MKISLKERRDSSRIAELHRRLTTTYNKLHDRVDNPKHKQYKDYGGRGVTIDKKWYTLTGFLDDVDKIPGWDTNKFLNHSIELDKDLRVPGNKIYSLETCKWVSHRENMQLQPLRQNPFYAYNEYTGEIKKGLNQRMFAIEEGISQSTISSALNGRKHRSGDWWIWGVNDEPPVPKRYYFTDRSGYTSWDVNPRRLALKLGRDPRYINGIIAKGAPKGTTITIIEINLNEYIATYNKSSTTKLSSSHSKGNDENGIRKPHMRK